MRAVLQRVSEAEVEVEGGTVGRIGEGVVVFLGIGEGDTADDAAYLASKVAHLRVFEDEERKMNRSVADVGGAVLVVSQFTLYGDCRRGRRPSFTGAMAPERAQGLYEHFVQCVRREGLMVETGTFQALMRVVVVNDGPVTFLLDSKREF